MGDFLKGDSKAPGSKTQAKDIVSALSLQLPQYTNLLNRANESSETSLFNLKKKLAPQEQELYNQLYSKYAPEYAKTANALEDIASEGELGRIQGSGGEAYKASEALARESDPEYYALRQQIADKLKELTDESLSGNEVEAITRGQNRMNAQTSGDVTSNMNTVSNAMTFGNAARDRLGQALSYAIQATPSFKTTSASDIFNTASGRGRNTNQQTQAFGNTVGTSGLDLGQGFSNSLYGLKNNEMNINANRRTILDYGMQAGESAGGTASKFAI